MGGNDSIKIYDQAYGVPTEQPTRPWKFPCCLVFWCSGCLGFACYGILFFGVALSVMIDLVRYNKCVPYIVVTNDC